MFDQSRIGDLDVLSLSLSRFANLQTLSFDFCKVSGRHLKRLAPLPKLQTVSMSATSLEDDEMVGFNVFPGIQTLFLDRCRVTDRGVSTLTLPELVTLSVAGTGVSENIPVALRGCPKLVVISLSNTAVSDKTLGLLGNRTALAALDLSQTSITNVGLLHLKKLRELRALYLDGTKVTDDGLIHLRTCRSLTILRLSKNRINGAGLFQLKELPLQEIDLADTDVSGRSLALLRSFAGLKKLNLTGCNALEVSTIEEFKNARPDIQVKHGKNRGGKSKSGNNW